MICNACSHPHDFHFYHSYMIEDKVHHLYECNQDKCDCKTEYIGDNHLEFDAMLSKLGLEVVRQG